MNLRVFTAWLPTDATAAYTPPAEGAAAVRKLLFDVKLKDSRGVEFVDKCVLDDPALMREYEPLLTAGRAVIVHGEQTARAWHDHGVLKGYVREVRIIKMEFPNRGGKKAAAEDEGEAA